MKILCIGNIERAEFRILWNRLPADARVHCEMVVKNQKLEWLPTATQADFASTDRPAPTDRPATADWSPMADQPTPTDRPIPTDQPIPSNPVAGDASGSVNSDSVNPDLANPDLATLNLAEQLAIEPPTWILLLRPYPGAFPQQIVDDLKRQFPLAPILTIQGTWCESELPAKRPVGTHLVYWYDFLTMFPQEWNALQNGQASVWSVPELGDVDTWFSGALAREKQNGTGTPNSAETPWKDGTQAENTDVLCVPNVPFQKCFTIAVSSEDYAIYAVLRDQFLKDPVLAGNVQVFSTNPAFREAGVGTYAGVDVLFCDLPDMGEASRAEFLRLAETFPEAKRVAMLEFPRWNEWQWLEEHGALVLPKPFRWTDLREVLRTWI